MTPDDLLLFVPISRHLPPSSPSHPSPKVSLVFRALFIWHCTLPSIYTIIFLNCQVTILARSSREMSLTVRIIWQYILSRVRVSIRPSIFLYEKNMTKLPRKPTFAYLTVEWTSGAAGYNALSDGHGWMARDPSLCRYNCVNSLLSRTDWPKTTKANQSKDDN